MRVLKVTTMRWRQRRAAGPRKNRPLSAALAAALTSVAYAVWIVSPSAAAADSRQPSISIWERPDLLRVEGGPRDWLEERGVRLKLSLTQFVQGQVSGEGDHTWKYSGRGDMTIAADLSKIGLWEGLSLSVHGQALFADDVNNVGDGSLLPINTAMAFPRLKGGDADLSSVFFTQMFANGIALSVGKIDMLDVASRTPLMGGGGVESFQNLAFAAPPSGLVPPAIFGALLNVPIQQVKLTVGVYDPEDATTNTGLESPFNEGVTGLLSLTVPIKIADLPGYHSLSVKANTKQGMDLDDLRGLELPPVSELILGQKRGAWNVAYSFQQYLHTASADTGGGWGIFGQIGLSDGNPTPIDWFGYVGLGGDRLIPDRDDDRFGVGFFYLSLSDDLEEGLRRLAGPLGRPELRVGDEWGVELFYNAAIARWLRLTADVQVIGPHETRKATAVFVGFRWQLVF